MRIAVLVNWFPSLSQTFVLNQVTGLIDRGHHVTIHTRGLAEKEPVHEDVLRYRLLERTYLLKKPKLALPLSSEILRGLANLRLYPGLSLKSPGLCVKRLVNLALALSNKADFDSYDLLHCQFGANGELGVWLKMLGVGAKVVTTPFPSAPG